MATTNYTDTLPIEEFDAMRADYDADPRNRLMQNAGIGAVLAVLRPQPVPGGHDAGNEHQTV